MSRELARLCKRNGAYNHGRVAVQIDIKSDIRGVAQRHPARHGDLRELVARKLVQKAAQSVQARKRKCLHHAFHHIRLEHVVIIQENQQLAARGLRRVVATGPVKAAAHVVQHQAAIG